MTLAHHAYPTRSAALDGALALLAPARARGVRATIVTRTAPAARSVQRALAVRGQGFAIDATTPRDLLADAWELFGDGRAIIDAAERWTALHAILNEGGTALSKGYVNLLVKLAREGLDAIDAPADMAEAETRARDALRTYRDRIHSRGLIEESEAAVALAGTAAASAYACVLLDATETDLPAPFARLFDAWSVPCITSTLTDPEPGDRAPELDTLARALFNRAAGEPAVAPTGAVRVQLSSGPLASRRALLDALRRALDGDPEARVAVATPHPDQMARYCNDALIRAQVSYALQTSCAFSDTDAGRALIEACTLVTNDQADVLLGADYGLNPFAGMRVSTAFFTDKTHRGNRLIDNSEMLTDLAGHAAEGLQGVIGLLEAGDAEGAIDAIEAWAARAFRAEPAYLSLQMAALEAARAAAQAADRWGLDPVALATRLDAQTLSLYAETAPNPGVTFCTLADLRDAAPASFDAVIVGCLESTSYPVQDKRDSFDTLMGKWSVATARNPLDTLRRSFFGALSAARRSFIVHRSLANETADDAQASVVFEELMDCYRIDPTARDSSDRDTGVALPLVPFTELAGEQDLTANETAEAAVELSEEPSPVTERISEDARPYIVLDQQRHGQVFPGLDLSASQIESYLECPYEWFAKRRLKLEQIAEGFGPAERGTFMHAVLESFYARFQKEVAPKVTADTLEAAGALMRDVFAEKAARQFTDTSLGKGQRYVPVTPWEEKQRDDVLVKLLGWLPFETTFLPSFEPRHMEWEYGATVPFSYAGCNLVGRIDRIDVDGQGRAVVIDYKSSLSDAYRPHLDPNGTAAKERAAQAAAAAKEREAARAAGLDVPEESAPSLELPHKVQALIYAKAVRDQLGYQVVGSLYVNPLNNTVQGAWDARSLDAVDVPFAKDADRRAGAVPFEGVASFDDLLDSCEEAIAARMRLLAQGRIAPDPHGADACQYCPVGNCSARLVARKL